MKTKQFNKPTIARTGKDIRRLLDEKAKPVQSTGYRHFIGSAETALAAIWEGLLGHTNIGREEDFFHAGGNSLKAVQMVSRITAHFKVDIKLTDVFYKRTIAELANHINGLSKNNPHLLIGRQSRSSLLPLSFSQERIWFIHQLEGSTQYHLPVVLTLRGHLHLSALSYALQTVVARHEPLRSILLQDNVDAHQQVIAPDSWELKTIDGSVFENDKKGLETCIRQLIYQPFNLSADYLLRASLIQITNAENVLVVTMHHIASDGWSLSVMATEINELYKSFVENRQPGLPLLPIQYADFAIWQRNYLQGTVLDNQTRYWKNKLQDTAPLPFPADFPRPAVQRIQGTISRFIIDKELMDAIEQLANEEGATVFMALLTAFKILLYRYTSQTDICVGTPTAGRQQQETEALIGFFVNTLALRTSVDKEDSFESLLTKIKRITIEAYEHQELPFEKVVETVVQERDTSRSPLFQVMFVLQDTPDKLQLDLPGLQASGELWDNGTSKFDFSFYLTQTASGIEGFVEYCTDLYREETISRLIGHYKELLTSIVKNPAQKIGHLPILTQAEEHQLLVEFNDTATTAIPASITDLFTKQATATPHAIAVQFEEEQLTYSELNNRANQLANYLIDKGITKEMLIPVCIERSNAMLVAIMGILKIGAAFVPVDPEYPAERINYMLSDTGASVILGSVGSRGKLQHFESAEIVLLNKDWPLIAAMPATDPGIVVPPHSLAYVIHTSGSTGMPKGVMIEHGSVVNLLQSVTDLAHFTPDSSFLSVTTFSFDICYLEFFVPLINGGKLVIIRRETAIDGFELAKTIAAHNATHLQATPATWQLLLDAGWKNKEGINILIGGEAVTEEIKNALTPLGNVFNLYGPTETTIWSVSKKLLSDEKVMIGKPLSNTSIYILSEELALLPIGVAGEICIGGAGLASGYLNRPDLTAQKFIPNPVPGQGHTLIYKTGDLGRWMPDGNIECLGRMDQQVKIRGYRIELGEIETVLMRSSMVQQAVVLAKHDAAGNKKLAGYYVPDWQVMKEMELALYQQQVERWKELYDVEYTLEEVADPEFDIGIWKDSFNAKPISKYEMQEWLQDIVADILSNNAGNVLEIGCGTGLIYYQLAGKINKYIGTDISAVSINKITRQIQKGLRNYGPTELKVCAAHEINLCAAERVDTIILNSIVQYFPGEKYMDDVMEKCISLIGDNGRIVIGDVRDHRLLELFNMRLQLQRMGHGVHTKELLWSVQKEVLKEEELCFSPEYFFRLSAAYPQISGVEIKWKNADSANELTLYRYTVILHLGLTEELPNPEWLSWKTEDAGRRIQQQLDAGKDVIAVKGAPNFRLWKERFLHHSLQHTTAATVEELLNATTIEDEGSAAIKTLYNTAKAKGYHIRLLLNDDPLKTDIIMEREFSGKVVYNAWPAQLSVKANVCTNITLLSDIAVQVQQELKSMLGRHLPEYMMPSELVAVKQFPLTNNGKIDRLFLSLREEEVIFGKQNYQPPQTDTEVALVKIWQEILNIRQIGIYDNFFELGGHSLMAMRLASAIRNQMQLELSVKDLFNHPTVAALAAHLTVSNNISLLPVIEPQVRPQFIPLSFSQERLWFIDKLEGSTQYHLTSILRLKGKLNEGSFKKAFRYIVDRHEVLRTVILEEEGKSYQSVRQNDGWDLHIIEDASFKNNSEAVQQCIRQLIKNPFDLSADYMLRASLIKIDEQDYVSVVTMHHIASDGWSTSIITKELLAVYAALVESREVELAPLPLQYADYAIWQRNYFQLEILAGKLAYWKKQLSGVQTLQLPLDFQRPAVQSIRGTITKFTIGKEISEQIKVISRQQNVTVFMTLMAAFNILMQRYSSQDDICIGTPVAGRQQQELEGLIGFFVNTFAIRTNLSNSPSFINLLQQVKGTMLDAYANQEVPFEKVVEAAGVERNMSSNPIFQVLFSMQNNPDLPELKLKGITFSVEDYEPYTSQLDIIFNITETPQGFAGSVEYCTDLFTRRTIDRMISHFEQLLKSVIRAPHESIGTMPMLSAAENSELLITFNNTTADYPTNKTVIDLFEEQAAKTPEATAIIFEDTQLTYGQLNERSNQLAHYLKKRGIKEEALVPICLERSIEMITGIWGILKAGAAYVPIDPDYPRERIKYMLEDTAADIIITTAVSKTLLPLDDTHIIIILDEDWEQISKEPTSKTANNLSPHNLAYCIYTSGSTGMPKGAMNEHAGLLNRLCWAQAYFQLTAQDAVLQKTTFAFDVSVWELLWPLLAGAKLVLAKPGGHKDTGYLQSVINSQKITMVHFVPSMLEAFLSDINPGECPGLAKVLCSGEVLKASHVQLFAEKLSHAELHNLYGPTEAAIDVTCYSFHQINSNIPIVPIGKPVANTAIYILDKQQNPVPVSVSGELYIGGVQVGRGYLHRPELTAEKFIPDPFTNRAGARMYRTGDLARWLPDGNIEYIGRMDEQVKIRGYRIEPGEIENVLQQSGLVQRCVVLAKENKQGHKRLIGYAVPKEGEGFDREAMLAYLGSRLPEYMVPAVWVAMQNFPQTPNGKLDRKALPEPDMEEGIGKSYIAPRNELESRLADSWQSLLGIERAGIHDNFFALGGDSILTIQVVSRMRRQGYELSPRDIFLHQTIAKLAAAITNRSAKATTTAEQGILTGASGLLPIQQWYFEKEPAAISHFNQAVLLGLNKSVTEETLQEVVAQLTLGHDALRFHYTNTNGQWQQHYSSSTGTVVTEDLQDTIEPATLPALIQHKANHHQQHLDIEKGEIIRAVLMQMPDTESSNRLLIIIHHLAIDGVSWRVLLEDMEQLLDDAVHGKKTNLGQKTSSYRQWYQALQQYGQSSSLLSQKSYWQQTIQHYAPLPVDKNDTEKVTAADINHHSLRLDAAATRQLLQEVSQVYHTEINDMLLAALAQTLMEWAGTSKVVIGLEGHGREVAIAEGIDLSRTVGWFTTLYPVLLQVDGPEEADAANLIKSIKEQLRKVPGRGLGYGVLKYINEEASLQTDHNSWDIVFNYLGQLDNVVKESPWLAGAKESTGTSAGALNEVSEKLSVNSSVRGGELTVNWSYSSKHYHPATVETLAANYLTNLQTLIRHCLKQQSTGLQQRTPSDYGLGAEVTYKELDTFLEEEHNGSPRRREQVQSLYRLSGLQQGMLFHSLYDKGAGYVSQFWCSLGNPDTDVLSRSWDYVLKSHTILRSSFYNPFSIPVQAVYKGVQLPVKIIDYRAMSGAEQAEALRQFGLSDRETGFDFEAAPLMRLYLFHLSENHYRMLWSSHHILLDGWSRSVVMGEFLNVYEGLISGKKLPAIKEDRYEEYIRFVERTDKEKEQAYWKKYLQPVEQSTLLPFISNTADRNKGTGLYASQILKINEETTQQVEKFVHQHHLTLNTLVQGVWAYLLHRYTGSNHIVYGVTVSGRPGQLPDVEQRVGMFINTLPLYTSYYTETALVEWLQNIQNDQVASREYEHTPLHQIQSWRGLQGDLFDSILVFENYPFSKVLESGKWQLQVTDVQISEQNNYPLSLVINPEDGEIKINFNYNTTLLEEVYVTKISQHFEQVLKQFIANSMQLGDIEMLTQMEQQQLLFHFNNNVLEYPATKTIIDLFEEQVNLTPDNIALVYEQEALTYTQLNERSNQLAHYLRGIGVKEEILVPVCIERSLDMIVGILAILKAGGAYVPIDPHYPAERINYILKDTKASAIVCHLAVKLTWQTDRDLRFIAVDDEWPAISAQPVHNLPSVVQPHHLVYVIYTSGSTGKPKGVMIEHAALTDHCYGVIQSAGLSVCSSFALFSPLVFDAGHSIIFVSFLQGASLYVLSDRLLTNGRKLFDYINHQSIDCIKIVPSLWLTYANGEDLILSEKVMIFGGEGFSKSILDRLIKANYSGVVYNHYGPTEATIGKTIHRVDLKKDYNNVPIGKPYSNTRLYILDDQLHLVPVGIAGELHIAGDGLARGYLNMPELTKDKFIADPFSPGKTARMYKTGDKARWLPDGDIEYLGRIDDQVKINGFRIELGEIESVLHQCGLVKQAVVLAKEDQHSNKRLVGYIVPKGSFEKDEIVNYLKGKLPAYMVPALWVELQTLPLTSNGKIDRKLLPQSAGELLSSRFVAPRNELETQLALIWKEILLIDKVGIYDNFFELGGHSLMVMRLLSSIKRELKIDIPVRALFELRTIEELANYIKVSQQRQEVLSDDYETIEL